MKKCKNKLVIQSSTWNKDSNELFDYECSDLIKLRLKTYSEGSIIRSNDEIKYVNQQQTYSKNSKTRLLVGLDCTSSQFFVKKPPAEENTETPWLVCKFLKNSVENAGYKLSVGDVIKLGRVRLKVKEIKLLELGDNSVDNNHTKHFATKINEKSFNADNRDRISNLNNDGNPNPKGITNNVLISQFNSTKNMVNLKKSKATCRICYCDETEVESPLISPCSCSGSMKFIHFSCLQTWLKSKIVVKSTVTDNCASYSLKQIECELCKVVFPDFVKYKGKLFDTKEFIKPSYKTYITLESAMTDKHSNRVLFYANLESKNNIRIGRGHDSDVRISDISVSRFHALIRKGKDDCLYLEDNISKFGTLILLQNSKINILTTALPLQIGRSLLYFNIKRPWSFFRCFSSKKEDEKDDYQIYNSEAINLENDVIVKVQDENENYEAEFSLDNKKRLECDMKSEKNSVVIQINLDGMNAENINEEEVKENNINEVNKSEDKKSHSHRDEEQKAINICFSEEMNIAEEHDHDKGELTIQNYRFFQKKTVDPQSQYIKEQIEKRIEDGVSSQKELPSVNDHAQIEYQAVNH